MAKYSEVQQDIEEIFGSQAWTSNNLTIYPSNYQGGQYTSEFMRLEILPSRPLTTYASLGISGNIIVQIYTEAGLGISRPIELADLLDTFLEQKTLPRGTQTGTSSISFLGLDAADNSLNRADYLVSFRRY